MMRKLKQISDDWGIDWIDFLVLPSAISSLVYALDKGGFFAWFLTFLLGIWIVLSILSFDSALKKRRQKSIKNQKKINKNE